MDNKQFGIYVLILVAVVLVAISFNNLTTEEKNPEDYECVEYGYKVVGTGLCSNRDLPQFKDFMCDNGEKAKIECVGSRLEFSCKEKCLKYSKKNPCQLKLEKEGILGEDCVCEEWTNAEYGECYIGLDEEDELIENFKSYRVGDIIKIPDDCKTFEELKKESKERGEEVRGRVLELTKEKECIKARPKTECEKNNPEYIKKCWIEKSTGECVEYRCFKKQLSDLTCYELEDAFLCNRDNWNMDSYKKCFGSSIGWQDEDEILFEIIKEDCELGLIEIEPKERIEGYGWLWITLLIIVVVMGIGYYVFKKK